MGRSGFTGRQKPQGKPVNRWLGAFGVVPFGSVPFSSVQWFSRLWAGAVLMCCVSCGGSGSGASSESPAALPRNQITFTTQPTMLRQDGRQAALLAHFVTNVPVRASYRLVTGADTNQDWQRHAEDFSRLHYQPIPLAKVISSSGGPSQPRLLINLQTANGATLQHELVLPQATTDLQRDSMPSLNWDPHIKRPALTLLSLSRVGQPHAGPAPAAEISDGGELGLLLAVDQTGELIWRYQHPEVIGQVLQRDTSSLMLVSASGVYVIDLLGTPVGWLGGQAQASAFNRPDQGVFVGTRVPGAARLGQPLAVLPDGHTLVFADTQEAKPALLELDPSGSVVWRRDLTESAVFGAPLGAASDQATYSLAYDPNSEVAAVAQGVSGLVVGVQKKQAAVLWRYPTEASQQNTIHSLAYALNGDLLVIDETPEKAAEPGQIRLSRVRINGTQPAAPVAQITLVANASSHGLSSQADDGQAGHRIAGPRPRLAKLVSGPPAEGQGIWVRSSSGTSITEVTDLQPGAQPLLNPVVALDDASASSWVIEDVLALNHDFSSADFAYAAARRRHAANADSGDDPKPQNVSFYGLAIAPDLSVEGIDVSGDWELFIGDAALAEPQALRLDQANGVVSGDFGGLPLTALIRGNTFSTTFRVGHGDEQTKFKYRGLVDSSESYMQGNVGLYRAGKLLDLTTWEARKR